MGLRYLSSDSEGMKSNLRRSIQQGQEVVQQLNSGSKQLINAVDGKTLSGAAYTAGKGLFSELIIPAINKVSSALDNVSSDLAKYEVQEKIVSGESILDEDSLLAERQIKRTLMDAARALGNKYKAEAKMIEHVPILDAGTGMFKNMAKQMENVAKSYQDEITKIEEKITKLHQFSEGIKGLFENGLQELKSAMQNVTALNSAVVDSNTGGYKLKTVNKVKTIKSLGSVDTYNALIKGATTDGSLKALEKLFGKGSDVLESSSNYMAALALSANGKLPQVKQYAVDIGKTGAKMGKVVKLIPILGSGLTFFDDISVSKDIGQAVIHTLVSTVAGLAIDALGIAAEPFTGVSAPGAFLANVTTQMEIDKFFENHPTKKISSDVDEMMKKRADMNDRYITNNNLLNSEEKKLLNKYSGDPMTVYRNVSNQGVYNSSIGGN